MSLFVDDLWQYLPHAYDDEERAHVLKTIDFIQRTPRAYERDHEALGHIGASALVWDQAQKRVLLTVHTVTNELSFFGNHADGNPDLPTKARARVAKEVSAPFAESLTLVPKLFDVDVHYVPPHTREGQPVPAHLHYDIMYLFLATQTLGTGSARWFEPHEVLSTQPDRQMQRLLTKLSSLG